MTSPDTSEHVGVDAQNPWPGLESFSEADALFFHGRTEEAAELLRRVKRESLTVLCSRSGLGKTSLLRAGLFPQLRAADYLPFRIRLDYSEPTQPLAEQVKTIIVAGLEAREYDAPRPLPEQTLWEYFHTKGTDFWDNKNRLIIPVLVFDQFEEIFTLGSRTEAHRKQSEAFLVELADLIENRPPAELKQKLEDKKAVPSAFVFSEATCKIVLSLREDYLAYLESLRDQIPSIGNNRMRIEPMTIDQAFEVVTKAAAPAGLVNDAVAKRIVNFVAAAEEAPRPGGNGNVRGGKLETDPALLSLFCRKLNDQRIKLGDPQITMGIVRGNSNEILTRFYDDCILALPSAAREGARNFVEDRLLTRPGHRDTIALDNALEEPDINAAIIDELVGRRLLRYDDRTGRRVELAHDVLVPVVRASRDARRQAKLEVIERERAEQERAAAAAKAQAESARAERERLEKERFEALATQAEKAKSDAEKLIEFMLYNLGSKLSAAGQLQLLGEVSERALEYFDGFEFADQTSTFKWNKAYALQGRGNIRMDAGKVTEALAAQSDSLAIFRDLALDADASDAYRNGVAAQCSYVANVLSVQGDSRGALELYQEAFGITQELLKAPNAAPYLIGNLSYFRDRIADMLKAHGRLEEAVDLYRESLKEREERKQAAGESWDEGIERELSDSYLSIGDGLRVQGRLSEALKFFNDSLAIRKQLADAKMYDVSHQQNLSQGYDRVGESLQASGQMDDAFKAYTTSDEIFQRLMLLDSSGSANWNRNFTVTRMRLAEVQSLAGNTAVAADVFSQMLVRRQLLADLDETNADAHEDLAEAHARVGESAILYGKLDEASENYQRAFELRSLFAEREPINADRQARMADSLERLGDLLCARNDFNEASAKYTRAREIRERLASTDQTNLARQADLATSIEKIGDAQRGLFQFSLARDSYAVAFEKKRELVRQDPENAQWQAVCAVSLRKLADTILITENIHKAYEYYLEGTAILQRLTETAEKYAEWMCYLGDLICSIAVARRLNGEPAMALTAFRNLIEVREAIAGMDPKNVKRQAELAWTLFLGATTIYQVESESKEEAANLLKRAHDIMLRCSETAELTKEQADWFGEIANEAKVRSISDTVGGEIAAADNSTSKSVEPGPTAAEVN